MTHRKAIYIIPSGRHHQQQRLMAGGWPAQEVARRPVVPTTRVLQRPTMAVQQPEIQRKRKAPPSIQPDEEEDQLDLNEVYELLGQSADDLEFAQHPPVPRKRERLTNLTPEEKMNRRKLKNRVAAQTARDRKKERSHKLEQVVRALLEETKRLRAENRSLRVENQRLQPQPQPHQWSYAPPSEAEAGLVEKEDFKSAEDLESIRLHHRRPAASQVHPHHQQVPPAHFDLLNIDDDLGPLEEQQQHPEEGGATVAELQAIFEDLFEGADPSTIDIDKFCNEVIEAESASPAVCGHYSPTLQGPPAAGEHPREGEVVAGQTGGLSPHRGNSLCPSSPTTSDGQQPSPLFQQQHQQMDTNLCWSLSPTHYDDLEETSPFSSYHTDDLFPFGLELENDFLSISSS